MNGNTARAIRKSNLAKPGAGEISFVLFALGGMVGCIAFAIRHTVTIASADTGRHHQQGDAVSLENVGTRSQPWLAEPMRVMFLRLLDTIDDIGRLMSMNYEVDMLLPAIVSTAKSALNAAHCEVHLWDPRQRALRSHPAAQGNRQRRFVPSEETALWTSVVSERRAWIRQGTNDSTERVVIAEDQQHLPDAIVPLTAGSELLGLLIVIRVHSKSPQFDQLLHALANIYALAIRNAQLFRRTQELAEQDGLTGLYNHATFQQRLRVMIDAAHEQLTPLSVLMGDIDHFKRFNDSYGHQMGDEVLRQVSRLWKSVLPDSALLARYGGEEFIAALPGIDQSRAVLLAESLRRTIENHRTTWHDHELRVTSSFGVAELSRLEQSADELVLVADQCLYASKGSGRNRVMPFAQSITRTVHEPVTSSP